MLLQAFDFWWLHEHKGCTLQLGGSDQWGNITAGIDLIRKRSGAAAHGLTWPLLTRSDGQKFGKTAEGTVWLSAERTIPFDFHQYFLRSDDRDVETLLAQLTLLPMADIEEAMNEHHKSPEQRAAQRVLADEVTKFVHGENHVRKANDAAQVLYGNAELTAELLESTRGIVGEVLVSRGDLEGEAALETLLAQSGLCSSLSDARRQLSQSAVLINNERMHSRRSSRSPSPQADRQAPRQLPAPTTRQKRTPPSNRGIANGPTASSKAEAGDGVSFLGEFACVSEHKKDAPLPAVALEKTFQENPQKFLAQEVVIVTPMCYS